MHLPDLCFVRMQVFKVAAKLRNRRKTWFLGPRFLGGGYTPELSELGGYDEK